MLLRVLISLMIAAASASVEPQRPPVRVVFETEKGAITIEVDVQHAPVSAANFLKYVDAGAYDGGRFHRSVRPDTEINAENPIQVIQGARNAAKPVLPAIALERTSVTGLKHLDGTVSMARRGPDTATDEFFICIGAQPSLDFDGKRNADGQGFAAFGRVVSGMNVVKAIQAAPVADAPAGSPASAAGKKSQTLAPPIAIVKARRAGTRP